MIRRLALHYILEKNKSQQELIHLLLQETMYHSGFVCVNIHLDRHDVRKKNYLKVHQWKVEHDYYTQNLFVIMLSKTEMIGICNFKLFQAIKNKNKPTGQEDKAYCRACISETEQFVNIMFLPFLLQLFPVKTQTMVR